MHSITHSLTLGGKGSESHCMIHGFSVRIRSVPSQIDIAWCKASLQDLNVGLEAFPVRSILHCSRLHSGVTQHRIQDLNVGLEGFTDPRYMAEVFIVAWYNAGFQI